MAVRLIEEDHVTMSLQLPMNPAPPALEAITLDPGKRYLINVRAARPLAPQEYESIKAAVRAVRDAIEDESKTVVLLVHGPEIERVEIDAIAETPNGRAA